MSGTVALRRRFCTSFSGWTSCSPEADQALSTVLAERVALLSYGALQRPLDSVIRFVKE